MQPGKLIRILLAGFCLALIAGLVLEHRLSANRNMTKTLKPHAGTKPQVEIEDTFKLPEFIRLNLVQKQPLFNADRLPIPEQALEAEQVADVRQRKPKPPALILTGVAIKDGKHIAIMHDKKTRKSKSIILGESMDSNKTKWILQSVDPRQVVIKDGTRDKQEVLDLDVYIGSLGQGRERKNTRKKAAEKRPEAQQEKQDKGHAAALQEESDNKTKPVNGTDPGKHQKQRESKQ